LKSTQCCCCNVFGTAWRWTMNHFGSILCKWRYAICTFRPHDLRRWLSGIFFEVFRAFDYSVMSGKFHDDISNGSRVVVLTSIQKYTDTAESLRSCVVIWIYRMYVA